MCIKKWYIGSSDSDACLDTQTITPAISSPVLLKKIFNERKQHDRNYE